MSDNNPYRSPEAKSADEAPASSSNMTAPKRSWSLIIGVVLLAIGMAMMMVAAGVFTATTEPPAFISTIGGVSFFTWWIPFFPGLFLVLIGQSR